MIKVQSNIYNLPVNSNVQQCNFPENIVGYGNDRDLSNFYKGSLSNVLNLFLDKYFLIKIS